MKTVIIHLSDIHFIDGDNWVVNRIPLIARAVQPNLASANACFIVVTGDIAFSGKQEEYEIAHEALIKLKEIIGNEHSDLQIELVLIPGNHDCDFTTEGALRVALLHTGSSIFDQFDLRDDSVPRVLVQTQDNFFSFLAKLEGKDQLEGYDRLYFRRRFDAQGHRFRFDCYNTACFSRKNERPSELIFPTNLVPEGESGSDVVVAAFHHPTWWLEPNNARSFRSRVEPISNIILVGHEHVPDQYTKHHPLSGDTSLYLEGGVLQGRSLDESAFNLIELDLANTQKRLTEFAWRRDIYEPVKADEWTTLEKPNQREHKFENSAYYIGTLNDPGANFSHPSHKSLLLDDIFVFPELTILPLEKIPDEKSALPIIDSEKVIEFVLDHPKIVFAGAELAGKTALSRSLYVHLQKREFVPVMLQGIDIRSRSEEDFNKMVNRRIEEQYSAGGVIRYGQLEREKRILLIDDFHKVQRLNRKGREILLNIADKLFGRILLFVNELFTFEEMAQEPSKGDPLSHYTHAELAEFGHRMRYQLASKWINLGQEFTGNEEQISQRINETADIVTTLLGRRMVPKYPIFILSILQALETSTNLNTASGAYGYFYEVIILQSLALHRAPSIPMDMLTTYLTLFAFRLFGLRRRALTADEIDEVTSQYFQDYGVRFDRESVMETLEVSKILRRENEGAYRFRYKYIYYYFVAKYFATNLGAPSQQRKVRKLIHQMTDHLYVEDYANIIIFLVYLTKDEKTITKVLQKAKAQFSEFEPFDLDTHVDFINKLQLDVPKPLLTAGDVKANKDAHLRDIDTVERRIEADGKSEDEDADAYEQEVNDAIRMNVAAKTLQIAGQILRNFPGALRRKQKFELAVESNLLGLRLLTVIFDAVEQNVERSRTHFAGIIKEMTGEMDDDELARKVDVLLFAISAGVSYGFIKQIANTIGSEHLKETYKEALKVGPDIPTGLVALLIKLDHFRPFPEKEALELVQEVSKNKLALAVLRQIVRDHFYLYEEDYKLRQRICNKIGIQFQDRRMIETKYKA